MNATSEELQVRWKIQRDTADVLSIERACFGPLAYSERDLAELSRPEGNVSSCVVENRSGDIVGYCLYALEKEHIHILRLAVRPSWQRQGIGTILIGKLKSKLEAHRRAHLLIAVSEYNLQAQLFLRELGFLCEAEEIGEDTPDEYIFVYSVDATQHVEN